MAKKCVKCGVRLGNKSLYCDKCGAVQPAKSAPKTAAVKESGNGLAMVVSALPMLALAAAVTVMLVTVGGNFGVFGYDDIPLDLFDFFEALSGRKTPYQLFVSAMRTKTLWVGAILAVAAGLLLAKVSKEGDNIGFCVGCGVMSVMPMLTSGLLLWLYSFDASPRVAVTVLFYLLAAAALALFVYMARYIGFRAVLVLVLSLALGAIVAVFLGPLLGAGIVFFGELFWIVVFCLLVGCSGTGGGVVYVYIVRW